jgi:hypothetical protein
VVKEGGGGVGGDNRRECPSFPPPPPPWSSRQCAPPCLCLWRSARLPRRRLRRPLCLSQPVVKEGEGGGGWRR